MNCNKTNSDGDGDGDGDGDKDRVDYGLLSGPHLTIAETENPPDDDLIARIGLQQKIGDL